MEYDSGQGYDEMPNISAAQMAAQDVQDADQYSQEMDQ
jgi:hypothetical protein